MCKSENNSKASSQLLNLVRQVYQSKEPKSRWEAAVRFREALEQRIKDSRGGYSRSSSTVNLNVLEEIYPNLANLLSSNDLLERVTGVVCLNCLLDLHGEPYREKVQRTYNGLRTVIQAIDSIPLSPRTTELFLFSCSTGILRTDTKDSSEMDFMQHDLVEVDLIVTTAAALGRLARIDGLLVNRCVETEIVRCFERMTVKSHENVHSIVAKSLSIAILKEIISNCPLFFYSRRTEFIKQIWSGLWDTRSIIRLDSAVCLQVFIHKVLKRYASEMEFLVGKLVDTAIGILQSLNSEDGDERDSFSDCDSECEAAELSPEKLAKLHGCLLTLEELLKDQDTRELLREHFHLLCRFMLGFRSLTSFSIRSTLGSCLTALASLDPELFCDPSKGYLDRAVHLFKEFNELYVEVNNPGYHILLFGKLAYGVGIEHAKSWIDVVFKMITEALMQKSESTHGPNKGPLAESIFTCISLLASSIRDNDPRFVAVFEELIDLMFAHQLSPALVESLGCIAKYFPFFLVEIQDRLILAIDRIFLQLNNHEMNALPSSRVNNKSYNKKHSMVRKFDETRSWSKEELFCLELALNTLSSFEFEGHFFSPLIREKVAELMDCGVSHIRRLAMFACCKMIASWIPYCLSSSSCSPLIKRVRDSLSRDVKALTEQILTSSITDPDSSIRLAALEGLSDERFSWHVSQPEALEKLVIVLYDENIPTRKAALELCGRLSKYNPGVILPVLRRLLCQILRIVEYNGSSEVLHTLRSNACVLLASLVRETSSLVEPYVEPILTVLLWRMKHILRALSSSSVLDSRALNAQTEIYSAIGNLAVCFGQSFSLMKLLPDVISTLIMTVEDELLDAKAKVAATNALCLVVRYSKIVLTPYSSHPELLSKLMRIIQMDTNAEVRQAVERLLGTIGAIDPKEVEYTSLNETEEEETVSTLESLSMSFNHNNFRKSPLLRSSDDHSYSHQLENSPNSMRSHSKASFSDSHLSHSSGSETAFRSGLRSSSFEEGLLSPAVLEIAFSKKSLVSRLDRPYSKSDDYFYAAALDCLHRIVLDPKSAQYHREALHAMASIVKSFHSTCMWLVPVTLSKLLWLLRPAGTRIVRNTSILERNITEEVSKNKIGISPKRRTGSVESADSLSGSSPTSSPVISSAALYVTHGSSSSSSSSATHLDPHLREFVLRLLCSLIEFAKQNVRSFARDIVATVRYYWERDPSVSELKVIFEIVRLLSCILSDEFYEYIPAFAACITNTLRSDSSNDREITIHMLAMLEFFGPHLDDYPSILREILKTLLEVNLNVNTRKKILDFIVAIIPHIQVTEIGSFLMRLTVNILRGSDAKEFVSIITHIFYLVGVASPMLLSLFVDDILSILCRIEGTLDSQFLELIQEEYGMEFGHRITDEESIRRRNRNYSMHMTSSTSNSLDADPFENEDIDEFNNTSTEFNRNLYMQMNEDALKSSWEIGRRTTSEDWEEWMSKFSVALFRESPSVAIRSCSRLAEVYTPMLRELFNAAFLSCWISLQQSAQHHLARVISEAMHSENIPLDALQNLLSLIEYMEHDEKPLPFNVRSLAKMAFRCGAFAKALRYKEAEYAEVENSQSALSAVAGPHGLISIYDKLNQQDSAVGILEDVEMRFGIERRQEWYEKLQQWDEALAAYDGNLNFKETRINKFDTLNITSLSSKPLLSSQPQPFLDDPLEEPFVILSESDRLFGILRCLEELGYWRREEQLCEEMWECASESDKRKIAEQGGASVALTLQKWNEFEERIPYISNNKLLKVCCEAILQMKKKNYDMAESLIDSSRKYLDIRLKARAAEGYERAYYDVLNAERIVELEEACAFLRNPTSSMKRNLAELWSARLKGLPYNYFYWYQLIRTRSLVFEPQETMQQWIQFSKLCRKAQRYPMAANAIRFLLAYPEAMPDEQPSSWDVELAMKDSHPEVSFALLKHLFETDDRVKAFKMLRMEASSEIRDDEGNLAARRYLKLAKWARQLEEEKALLQLQGQDDEDDFDEKLDLSAIEMVQRLDELSARHISPKAVLHYATKATELSPDWFKTWHVWACINAELIETAGRSFPKKGSAYSQEQSREDDPKSTNDRSKLLVIAAITGFFRAVSLSSGSASRLQDILRLLTLWFRYGHIQEVNISVNSGVAAAEVDTWLEVIPQLIARLHVNNQAVRSAIRSLLIRIGRRHPQALVYPLHVATKSTNKIRRETAEEVVHSIRFHSPTLVEQAEMVSKELLRVAILWQELWHEGLEEASRLYFGEGNSEGMLEILEPLHEMIDNGAETIAEMEFLRDFGQDLRDAASFCERYKSSGKESDMNQAWEIYYQVFRKINKQVPQMTSLHLANVSSKLLNVRFLELAVPGTYRSEENSIEKNSIVRIAAIDPTLQVISSKQRPRRLTMYGSDGKEYTFLLKGHEDLRQDERVMQLFGLVNDLLSQNIKTNSNQCKIKRFSVIPLSPNTGLIGWVPNCYTVHSIIREYREQRKIVLNIEHRLMLQVAPDYDELTLPMKLEAFEHAISNTNGFDISKSMFLKSKNSEVWLAHRTMYIRSLATMSMVGFILGLGDRHPSNLLMEKGSGRIIHIDFGDCFEVAMLREKFPEKVPFRLTRMLVNAMEICGVEGKFRHSCEQVMQVLRNHRDSLMAVLEAFVHDPLINWRLLMDNENVPLIETVPMMKDHQGLNEKALKEAYELSMQGGVSLSASKSLLMGRTGISLSQMARVHSGESLKDEDVFLSSSKRPEYSFSLRPGETPAEVVLRDLERKKGTEAIETMNEELNKRALSVIHRVQCKLTGNDYVEYEVHSVPAQVSRLIADAMNIENLCQCYVGWCPFW
ncbi:serine/threonine-protein kinase ATR [Galdieria sulphuraria]|uniref:Serine/threonine-protein kinase TOR n=1 Tax=Galdieria sulphuraria TaxID=130081 RepID=M2XYB9_GALSU|nr:serine/threonine-protein kinase ATR [Galdieria sulphuraria]EME28648.1 serine/threonine-protein kinase ATR [Galdieria sulphuraria]|eukprot:XP_005705168.1 serine/threonine-protein kinase ATR [Galdieria sulphuraria]